MPTRKRLFVDNRKPHGKPHSSAVDWEALLARIPGGKTVVHYETDSQIFRQGDPADALFYLRGGKAKLSVTSEEGKEAIIAFLDADEFFGEGCLAGQPLRMATATAMEASAVTRIAKPLMAQMVGTTRSRVNYFMNKFKKLGFIKYNGGLTVNSGLLSVLLAHDMSELTR